MAETERRDNIPPNEENDGGLARIDKEGVEEEARLKMGGFRHSHTAEPAEPEGEQAGAEKPAERARG